jgi:hypothetical protein
MDKRKRTALETAGWREGTVQEFLGLTDEENQIVALRAAIALQIRRLRRDLGMTQEEFARRIRSSPSRVAQLEAATATLSLDLMFRGFFAAGGTLADLTLASGHTRSGRSRRTRHAGAKTKAVGSE